jgi:His-Xaa-Ser system protein HxsD
MIDTFDWVARNADECLLDVDTGVYEIAAIMRACYRFTDHLYVFLSRPADNVLRIHIAAKDGSDAMQIAGQLSNAFLDEQLRASIASETRSIRDLIYQQAFAEADFERRDP